MEASDYTAFDGLGLSELLRRREVSARELVDAAYAGIERLNPILNAVVRLHHDRVDGTLAAGIPDGPFTGVPVLLKDEHDLAGTVASRGSVLLRDEVCTGTHEVIRRMEQAGALLLGRTNMPEFGLLPFTEPALYGPTRNPWNLDYSPGGSSGGSAAAVAAGIVPIATGGDGGGSIRIPASACGVFGLKPSRGRNPSRLPGYDSGISVNHVLTRSVRDSAAMLDATCGPRPGDFFHLPLPERTYLEVVSRDPQPLRIGFTAADFAGNVAHPDCVEAVRTMASRCRDLGHEVEEASPSIEGEEYYQAFKLRWCQGAGSVVKATQQALSTSDRLPPVLRRVLRSEAALRLFLSVYRRQGLPLIERFTRRLARIDAAGAPSDLLIANRILRRAELVVTRFLEPYDLLLTPVIAEPPHKIGTFRDDWPIARAEDFLLRYVGYTPIANTGGFPAVSIPTTWNENGLPIGTQLIGPIAREDRLLGLSAQIERAFPWSNRRPTVETPG